MNLTELVKSRISDKLFTFDCEYERITSSINRFGTQKPLEKVVYSFKCLHIPDSKGEKAKFVFTTNGVDTQSEGYILVNRLDLESVGLFGLMKAGDYFKIGTQRYEVIGIVDVAPDVRDSNTFVLVKLFYRKDS